MTTTTPTSSSATTAATTAAPGDATRRPVWRAGLLSGLAAAVATTVVVAVARAADVPLAVDGEEIPLLAFAQLTLVGAALGIGIAALVRRITSRPRRTFAAVAVALTALSLVPDLAVDATTATKLVLALTHVVAAAIIIPALASRLAD